MTAISRGGPLFALRLVGKYGGLYRLWIGRMASTRAPVLVSGEELDDGDVYDGSGCLKFGGGRGGRWSLVRTPEVEKEQVERRRVVGARATFNRGERAVKTV